MVITSRDWQSASTHATNTDINEPMWQSKIITVKITSYIITVILSKPVRNVKQSLPLFIYGSTNKNDFGRGSLPSQHVHAELRMGQSGYMGLK